MVAAWAGERLDPEVVEPRLSEFTELVATAIANAESRAELAASRARVVAASDLTRRRIERNLHDGTQQRLISVGLQLRAAEALASPDQAELRAQISDAAQGLTGAVAELQEISRGIHPAILSRGGLGEALKALARRSSVPVELHVAVDGELPEQVEVASYYLVSEALTNAAKHARASVLQVDAETDNGVVRLSITDDGVGGADPEAGSGLVGLKDRVEALGGDLRISSAPGHGTALHATIPIEPGGSSMMSAMPTRVAVADDDVLLREGIASLLERSGFEVVGQAGDGSELLELVRAHEPELVIVDIRMPPNHETEGLDAARVIRAEMPHTGIVLLSAHVEVDQAMELLAAGERTGYLLKSRVTDVTHFLESLDRIVEGGSVVDPGLVQELVAPGTATIRSLTSRRASARCSPLWPRGARTPASRAASGSPRARSRSTFTASSRSWRFRRATTTTGVCSR